jgi:potassium channel subfamily K
MIYLSTFLSFPCIEGIVLIELFCRDWWVASTAFPLLAATIGPLANVLSIAALVTKWRVNLPNNGQLPEGMDDAGTDIADPHW